MKSDRERHIMTARQSLVLYYIATFTIKHIRENNLCVLGRRDHHRVQSVSIIKEHYHHLGGETGTERVKMNDRDSHTCRDQQNRINYPRGDGKLYLNKICCKFSLTMVSS